ncbi:hypothetical protein ACJ41O_010917 [Fusarium nematophilum]
MDLVNSRLCVFCRRLELKDAPCPWPQRQETKQAISSSTEITKPWTRQDESLIEELRQHPSALCKRCHDFDILRAFAEAEPLDERQRLSLSNSEYVEYLEAQDRYRMQLGLLSSFIITPTCPLCRLIYRLIPRPPPDHDTTVLALRPYRWHIRQGHWEVISESAKQDFAIWFGLSTPQVHALSGRSFFASGEHLRTAMMTGEAIALKPSTRSSKGPYTARLIDEMIDFERIRKGLEHCQTTHPKECQAMFDQGLLATRMVDVIARKTVDCPDQCDYLALSYVWGGVHPEPGALEAGTLPQTIEDAITITKRLGKRYLWVDALCIDQSPNPTAEQAAAKAKQLQLMHLIYYCATITIFAVAGPRSDYGIPGVSRPRVASTQEVIDGQTIVAVPPQIMTEVQASVWQTRAWTWQEDTLSTRKLFLTETQYQLQCNETLGPSYYSEACDTVSDLTWTQASGGKMKAGFVQTDNTDFLDRTPSLFQTVLTTYTSRFLTNEEDSLNAFQGGLMKFGMAVYPDGFEWGMPLKSFPQSLAWIHDYTVTPKRRSSFPSWSWAGWGGTVQYPSGLIETASEKSDLVPRMVRIDDKHVTLEGWTVTLDIRTEPFSEVVVPGSDTSIGGGCLRSRRPRACEYPSPTIPLRDRRALEKLPKPWEELTFVTNKRALKQSEAMFSKGIMTDTIHLTSDPFDCLAIDMPFKSKELFHYFHQVNQELNLVTQDQDNNCLSSATSDPGAFRCTLLIAAMHFEWTTGAMKSFEPTFLFHKVQAIQVVNNWISEKQPRLITAMIRQIATLCFVEICFGHVFSAQAHLNGMVTLLQHRRRLLDEFREKGRPHEEDSAQDEELTDRYFLLILTLFARHKSRLLDVLRFGHVPESYRNLSPQDLENLARVDDLVERNCEFDVKLHLLRLIPFFSCPLPTGSNLHWIDGSDTILVIQELTDSIDMVQSKPDACDLENEFAMVCANGVASQLHVQYIASHMRSISHGPSTRHASKPTTTWCGLYISTGLYLLNVLGLRESLDTACQDYVMHIFKRAVTRHLAELKDGRSMSEHVLFWQIFLGAISVEKSYRQGAGDGSSMGEFFDEAIWKWSRAAGVSRWEDARGVLERVAWRSVDAEEGLAMAIWERACYK